MCWLSGRWKGSREVRWDDRGEKERGNDSRTCPGSPYIYQIRAEIEIETYAISHSVLTACLSLWSFSPSRFSIPPVFAFCLVSCLLVLSSPTLPFLLHSLFSSRGEYFSFQPHQLTLHICHSESSTVRRSRRLVPLWLCVGGAHLPSFDCASWRCGVDFGFRLTGAGMMFRLTNFTDEFLRVQPSPPTYSSRLTPSPPLSSHSSMSAFYSVCMFANNIAVHVARCIGIQLFFARFFFYL